MTFEDLKKANETLSTMDIKGKNYVLVNERVKAFRMLYPEGTITTTILSLENGVVTMKADVIDESGRLLASGMAQEKETSSYINKTSYIENCETSAVGRALGFLGIGVDTSIASYEEVQNAVNNQEKAPKPKTIREDEADYLYDLISDAGKDLNWILNHFKVKELKELTRQQMMQIANSLKNDEDQRNEGQSNSGNSDGAT